jgi:hypothetical protein
MFIAKICAIRRRAPYKAGLFITKAIFFLKGKFLSAKDG